jgi:hypothetical protein
MRPEVEVTAASEFMGSFTVGPTVTNLAMVSMTTTDSATAISVVL